MKPLLMFDTTLRDGEQGIGNLMTLEMKSELLPLIDSLGVDIIELAFPAASKEDIAWCHHAATLKFNATPCVLARMNKSDIDLAIEACKYFRSFQIELIAVGSELHLRKKRRMSEQAVLEEQTKSIEYLKQCGVKNISVAFEDATRGSLEYLTKLVKAAVKSGATTICLADTVGFAHPGHIYDMVKHIRKNIPDNIILSIHCHNDLGLATANTLTAVQAGADSVQTTVGGIGERAGNCSLEEVAATLHYKEKVFNATTNINLKKMPKVCEKLFLLLEKPIPLNKPIVGAGVFATAAGIHQNGMIKDPEVYEYVEAEKFGRERKFLMNRLSSKHLQEQELISRGIEYLILKHHHPRTLFRRTRH